MTSGGGGPYSVDFLVIAGGGAGGGGIHDNGGTPFRKNHAGMGYTYDETRDAFIQPKPYNSWVLNEDTCLWDTPIPKPDNENKYTWNEENQSWTLQTI